MGNAAEQLEVRVPYNFTPRAYQDPLFVAMNTGKKRGLLLWHRRAGKDKDCLNYTIEQMMKRVGVYYYLFPTYAQGKKVIWKGIDADGFKTLHHFPEQLIAATNESDLSIEFVNGSYFQVIGTDNYDAIMGTNPVGCVFSEYALQDPRAWDYLRPILMENGGWAIFPYTPRGKNHGYDLYEMAKDNPDWYCNKLTIEDTKRPDGSPVVSQAMVQAEREQGMDEELIQQEFYCSFTMGVQGAYFTKQVQKAEADDRITSVPYDERLPVMTFWDLGMDDSMTIWFVQVVGREIRFIDYAEGSGEGFPFYAKLLRERDYVYGPFHLPHDANVRELGTGDSRVEAAEKLGIKPVTVIPRVKRKDQAIEAARGSFSRCWFDKVKCRDGLNGLKNYTKEFDEKKKVFKNTPLHNWASHAADAFMTFATGYSDQMKPKGAAPGYSGQDGWMG